MSEIKLDENINKARDGGEIPPVGQTDSKCGLVWILVIVALVLGSAVGLGLGWTVFAGDKTAISPAMAAADPCGQTAEAVRLRNLAWDGMNGDSTPGTPEGQLGLYLQIMSMKAAPVQLRTIGLDRYLRKAVRYSTKEIATEMAGRFAGPDQAERMRVIDSIVSADLRLARLAQCLLKDKERMAKAAIGAEVPLETVPGQQTISQTPVSR